MPEQLSDGIEAPRDTRETVLPNKAELAGIAINIGAQAVMYSEMFSDHPDSNVILPAVVATALSGAGTVISYVRRNFA